MPNWFHTYANPNRFERLADKLLPWLAVATAVTFGVGLYYAFFNSPADYQQGETVRIMYVHVPAAWMALFSYACLAVASAVALIWKHPLAEVAARSAAPIGAAFTIIALATGSLWGKPMWGTWWEWDARMTSVLILLFIYIGYMALVDAFDDPNRGAQAGSILALVGAVNLPIIKFSVDWWNTLHQPASVSRLDTPAIDASMLTPLLIMALAFKLYFLTVLLLRIKSDIAARKVRMMQMSRVFSAEVAAGVEIAKTGEHPAE